MEKYDFKTYSVIINEDSFDFLTGGIRAFTFNVRTRVSTPDKLDEDKNIICADIDYHDGTLYVVWHTESEIWTKKEYILCCGDSGAAYYVRVFGTDKIGKIKYFSSPFRKNEYEVSGYFTPITTHDGKENRHFSVTESFSLALGYMTPPPLCYSFCAEDVDKRIGIALMAAPGKYNFESFDYKYSLSEFDFSFETDYFGYQTADGAFETAQIMIFVGNDDFDVLRKYRDYSYELGFAERRIGEKADWWLGPLFCGWGEQCFLNPSNPGAMATREQYEIMSDKLDERKIYPTAIIIDDKWQKYFGEALPDEEKWPDMRGFVDKQHEKGRRVILWFKTWNSEGLADSEQVHCLCRPIAPDPTNPQYIERIKNTVHKLLSSDEGCYNCDGFKIDFANCMPLGANISTYEKGVYGIELLKRMLSLIYNAAKEAKHDALINNSCCHPYFAEVTDQARLHDYCGGARDAKTNLKNRSDIYKAVMDKASIDTDGPNCAVNRDTMRYLRYAAEIGVPDLYTLSSRAITDDNWIEISRIYEEYSQNIRSRGTARLDDGKE